MAEIHSLNNTDASNTARFNGASNVSTLDDAGRALEGIIARNYHDNDGTNTTTGSNTAYVIATNRSGITANSEARTFVIRFHVANNGACTFQVNALTAKPLRKRGNAALVTGDILQNDINLVVYNPAWDAFQVVGI